MLAVLEVPLVEGWSSGGGETVGTIACCSWATLVEDEDKEEEEEGEEGGEEGGEVRRRVKR